jgi:hypothetical protein
MFNRSLTSVTFNIQRNQLSHSGDHRSNHTITFSLLCFINLKSHLASLQKKVPVVRHLYDIAYDYTSEKFEDTKEVILRQVEARLVFL